MTNQHQKTLLFNKLDFAYSILLNRPDVHNAINDAVMEELESALQQLEETKDSLPVILSHTGNRTFCAGGDLKYFSGLDTARKCRDMSQRMQQILNRLENCGHFVILAATGQILGGGCEILTACHYAIVGEGCRLSFRQAPNGIITGWGGGRRLIRKVGRAHALRLTLAGDRISAEDAKNVGLVEEVLPDDDVPGRAQELCKMIINNDPEAIRGFLDLEIESRRLSDEDIVNLETEIFVRLWGGERFQSILKRFREGNK